MLPDNKKRLGCSQAGYQSFQLEYPTKTRLFQEEAKKWMGPLLIVIGCEDFLSLSTDTKANPLAILKAGTR